MYKLKLIIVLLVIKLSAFSQTVQPFPYKDNSFPWSVNIGDSTLKKTNDGAWLELGDSLNSKKGLLNARGLTSNIVFPSPGLQIYDINHKTLAVRNDTGWVYLLTTATVTTIDTAGKWFTSIYRKTASDSVFGVKGGISVFAFRDSVGTTDISGKLNISDTTAKWVTSIYRKTASDSIFLIKGGASIFAYRDSIGITNISGKLNISDTAAMLAPYATTASHSLLKTGNDFTLLNDTLFTVSDTPYVYGWNTESQRLQYNPSLNFIFNDPQNGDYLNYLDGAIVNTHQLQNTEFILDHPVDVVYIGNLDYLVGQSDYWVGGVHRSYPPTVVTLPNGTASPGEFRQDWIDLEAGGPTSVLGDNSVSGVGSPQELDASTQYGLTVVTINEADAVPATLPTNILVYDQNVGTPTEATVSGNATYNANATNAPLLNSKNIDVTGFTNAQNLTFTLAGSHSITEVTYLVIPIRKQNAIPNNSNFSVVLRSGTTNSNAITFTSRGMTRPANTAYYYITIPTSLFNLPAFNAVRITRQGTGSVHVQFDDIYFQLASGPVAGPAGNAITNIVTGSGTFLATTPNTTINLVGAGGITTAVSAGNTITINGTAVGSGLYLPLTFTGSNTVTIGVDALLMEADGGPGISITDFLQDYTHIGMTGVDPASNSSAEIIVNAASISMDSKVDIGGNNFTIFTIGGDTATFYKTSPGGLNDSLHFDLKILPYGDPASFTKMLVYNPSSGQIGQVDVAGGGGGGGGGSDSPDRINGTATAYITSLLGTNNLNITADDGGGNQSTIFQNFNGIGLTSNDNEFDLDPTGVRVVLDGSNTFRADADYSANYTDLSYIVKQDAWLTQGITSLLGGSVISTTTFSLQFQNTEGDNLSFNNHGLDISIAAIGEFFIGTDGSDHVAIFIDNRVGAEQVGIEYGGDYSANYTANSLIARKDAPAISSGSTAPASTPVKVGDIYIDITAKKLYFATGTSSSADWTIAN